MLDHRRDLLRHDRRMFDVGNELIQFPLSLHAPDRQHILVLCLKRVRRSRIVDQSSRERFHCDKSHSRLLALLHQFDVLLCRQIAERELKRLIKS